jgi:1-phosphofructokinase
VAQYAAKCEFMIFSGSLPADAPVKIFADLMAIARENGAKCILDTGALALEPGLASGPYLIKPNRAEVEDLLLRPLDSRRQLIAAARELIRRGAGQVLISLGAEGAVGVAGSEALYAAPPRISVKSSVGAGDTMVAVMAYAATKGLQFREAFQMAVAASAATVAMEGTRVADLAAIEALIPKVTLEVVEE